ncbi:MAG: zinc-ribbon domain-containing protein [Acutalibacteraceae bacterium]
MKVCPNCHAQLADDAVFCTTCGTQFVAAPQQPPVQQPVQQPAYTAPVTPVYDPYDHTAEFEAKDISDNKVFAMLVYLAGAIGIIIALLASHDSPYVKFHLRQAAKFLVLEMLLLIAMGVLVWTIIVPAAGAVCLGILAVLQIICFIQVCANKAKEPPIVRNFGFLK